MLLGIRLVYMLAALIQIILFAEMLKISNIYFFFKDLFFIFYFWVKENIESSGIF
jgi:hypothetical protein